MTIQEKHALKADERQELDALCTQAKRAAAGLSLASDSSRSAALEAYASFLDQGRKKILEANQADVAAAKRKGKTEAFLDRLFLDDSRIDSMIAGALAIAKLQDPVGKVIAEWQRPNGLTITRITCPIGVFFIIYESRPNVTLDAAALSIKSGNAAILRGSSDCMESNRAIMECIEAGNREAGLPPFSVQLVQTSERSAVDYLLSKDADIDVVIPRGGKSLIRHISKNTSIPLFKHLEGICHTYLDASADPQMAKEVVLNAKMRRTGICGATETLLVHEKAAAKCLPGVLQALEQAGCEIRCDQRAQAIYPGAKLATEEDWKTEYLDAIISVRVVDSIQEAIDHINAYGSHHTEAIISTDQNSVEKFFKEIQSSIVMHNASTQFADGGEFGLGAEIGISTGKLHARGPVGVEQLVTYKYLLKGEGQTRGS